MIIVLKQDAPKDKIHEFCTELEGMGLQINDSKGSESHILGLIGDTKAVAESWVLANPVVETCRRVTEPYKKANRKFHPDDSVIDVDGVKIGGGNFAVIAGPCSIESEEQITYCAQRVKAAGASLLLPRDAQRGPRPAQAGTPRHRCSHRDRDHEHRAPAPVRECRPHSGGCPQHAEL